MKIADCFILQCPYIRGLNSWNNLPPCARCIGFKCVFVEKVCPFFVQAQGYDSLMY